MATFLAVQFEVGGHPESLKYRSNGAAEEGRRATNFRYGKVPSSVSDKYGETRQFDATLRTGLQSDLLKCRVPSSPRNRNCLLRAAIVRRFLGASSLVSPMYRSSPRGRVRARSLRLSRWLVTSAAFPSSGKWPTGTPPSPVTSSPSWICLTCSRPLLVRP